MRFFGLIGFPLGHSFSQKYFTAYFEEKKIEAQYNLFPLNDISEFSELIKSNTFSGLNVTIPYKTQVMQYLDELDPTAAAIGAVNVIKFIRDNNTVQLKGFNTDVVGFENSIKPYLKPHHKKALILGTGGASKAVLYTLRKLGITTTYVSRHATEDVLSYEQLNEDIISENLLIVNTTPLGMYPKVDNCADIPYKHLTEKHLLYDVIYLPEETLFLQKGREKGATTVNGIEMLYGQAIAAWAIWNS
ncbi:MAG: shikimate dehydrogenase [Bacteroidales bacterium 36-12]|mgnify:CR=1 FL=1|nr:MAG: shikimate dehydrogenase [Bacteroidales bacterium 36-12]